MAKRCALSTGNLLRGGLPRNSVDRITDRPDMTSAVYRGRKASTQTNKQKYFQTLKMFYMKKYKDQDPNVFVLLACGTTSSTCGQLASYPLALIRTRLQAEGQYALLIGSLNFISLMSYFFHINKQNRHRSEA